ncbi:alpha/beta hydrolase [Caulobacter sp. DWR2-3-1b2]|uniref:alpha/beta hydrolase n=1 Tax=unclassified Caulobacter TaxID=2648921 RepID=UPI0019BBBBC0|nr:alpha/beta fold hydrolase [Caulobacter sp.]
MTVQPLRLAGKSGHGVLLVHGLTGAPAEMKPLAKRLARRGFEVAAPLLVGHGVDEATLLKTTWRDWLDGLCRSYDAFAAEVDTVHVAGICVGGALGLMLAAERPAIRAAAVYSMTFEYDGWNMPRFAVAAPVIQLAANLPGVRRLAWAETHPFGLKDERLRSLAQRAPDSLIEGAIDRLPLGALFQMYRLGRHLERMGKAITTPTLILHARDDDMSHPRNAYRLQSALGGPTRLHLLEDSYHMIHVDQERDVVAAMTASFFGAVEPQGDPVLGRRSHV